MLTYYHLLKMNPREARPYRIPRERILVKDHQETGSYSQTASQSWHACPKAYQAGVTGQGNFGTHRRVVRKWVSQ